MADIKVFILTSADEPAWQAYIDSHPDATLFHTLEWRDILRKGFGFEPYYLIAKSGGNVNGLLPLFLVNNLSGRKLISLPFSMFGGPLHDSPYILEALINQAKTLMSGLNVKFLLLRSPRELDKRVVDEIGLCESNIFQDFVVKLEKNPDILWQRIKNRKEIKKAKMFGLSCFFSEDTKALKEFYSLQLITRRRFGLPTPSFNYYKSFIDNIRSKIVLLKKDEKPVAGSVLFFFKDRILHVFGASDYRYQDWRPNDLMMWEIIKWGCHEGYSYLDLSNARLDQKGLAQFKRKWSPEVFNSPDYYYPSSAFQKVVKTQKPQLRIGSMFFRHLPISVARYVGHPVIKYFG